MTAVGELVGYLRLDTSDWDRKSDDAKRKIDDLARKSPTVKVQADTAGVLTKLEAVRAAMLRVQAAELALNDARNKSGNNSRQALSAEAALIGARNAATKAAIDASGAEDKLNSKMKEANALHYSFRQQLVAWGAVLATSIGPLLAAASAAVIGFGAAAGVAVLGVLGIRDAMKSGTALGQSYKQAFSGITSEFTNLKQLAAQNLFSGIAKGLDELRPAFGPLNADVAMFSKTIGTAFQIAMPGLVRVLQDLQPLFSMINGMILQGAQAFDHWTQAGGGFQKFIDYATANLPRVMSVLGNLLEAIVRLVAATAPFGSQVVGAINAFAEAINHIPVGVLAVLIPTIIALNAAMKGMAIIQSVTLNIAKFITSLGGGGIAGGAIGAVGGIVTLVATLGLLTMSIAHAMDKGKSFNDLLGHTAQSSANFEQALIQSKGVVDSSVVSSTALALQTSGLADQFGKAGIGLGSLTSAITGSDADFQAFYNTVATTDGVNVKMLGTLLQTRDAFKKGSADAKSYADTMLSTANSAATASIKIDGTTVAINAQTTAAGLLKDALDRLNGTSLGLEQTQNQFYDSLGNLTKRSKDYNGNLSVLNTTGRANREVIVQATQAANAHAQQVADDTAKTKGLSAGLHAGITDFQQHEAAIRSAAAAAGLDKSQVDALIHSIGRVPTHVSSNIQLTGAQQAAVELDTINAKLNALHDAHVRITSDIVTNIYQNVYKRDAMGGTAGGPKGATGGLFTGSGFKRYAIGGMVFGPGTSTSDSVPAMLSAGEFVMNAAATAKFLPTLHAMNKTPARSGMASGGLAAGSTPVVNYFMTVNVAGSIRSDKEISKIVVGEIDKQRRWKGDVGLMDAWSGQRALQQPVVNVIPPDSGNSMTS